MAHAPMRDRLVAVANANAGDPGGFLEDLSDLHADWHDEFVRTYGFLLFHHRVVRYFETIVNAQLQPAVSPYTGQDLAGLNAQPFGGDVANVDTLADLADFSSSIESWHNTVHAQLATATGTPMMDPRQNIFFRPFWRLHLYIDGFFVRALNQYGNRAHPGQFITTGSIAGHLEASHHGWVPRI